MNEPSEVPGEVRGALSAIPGFAGGRVVSRLSDGPTNQSWVVEREGGRYVLRLDLPETRLLGVNRAAESVVRERAAAAGLTPATVYSDPAAGIFLRRFETGRSWVPADLRQPDRLERLAGLLRALHRLPAAGPTFEPLAAMQRYAAQLGSVQADRLVTRARSVHERLRLESTRTSYCHNDLVCENIVEGERLQLIDWEYAAMGDPLFDLAVVIQHHALEPEFSDHLVQSYFEGNVPPAERRRLELQREFYQHLLDLWDLRTAMQEHQRA